MKFFKDELKKIRAFVFDVDGVLSHQSQNLTPDGELIRTSCTKDGYAIMYAIRKGYIIAVISGGGAPGVRERLEKLGVRPEDIYLKVANKTEALAEIEQRYSLDKEAIMYMGDDIPDYKVMKWDESNFPIDQYSYAKEAIQAGKMAFVSDVARIHALYEYGGLYFDTDVEVLKNFSELLKEQGAVLGTEDEKKTIGTGFMAFVPKHEICSKMLEYYKNNSFADQSSTMSNTQILAHLLRENYGVEPLEKIQKFNDVTVYPSRYFTAYNGVTGRTEIAKDTCCIHHFGASWLSPTRRFKDKIKTLINRII